MPIYREISALQKLGVWKNQQKVQKQAAAPAEKATESTSATQEDDQDSSGTT